MAHPSHSHSTTQTISLMMSSFRGRAVQLASHDSKEFGAFCFAFVARVMAIIRQQSLRPGFQFGVRGPRPGGALRCVDSSQSEKFRTGAEW